jgi:hypothetical protein
VYSFVREHLRCGAMVVLAFVRAHYPEIDLELLKTLPPSPNGHYNMEHQATVLLDRLSSKVIGKERTRVPRRHELALWLCLYLHSVYVLCTCVVFVCGKKAEISSVGQEGEKSPNVGRENATLERRSRERSLRAWAKPPSVGRKAKPPSVGEAPERGSKGQVPERRRSPRAWVERPSPRA